MLFSEARLLPNGVDLPVVTVIDLENGFLRLQPPRRQLRRSAGGATNGSSSGVE